MMTEREHERLRTLRREPQRVNQTIHGCCGPAAILMSLLAGRDDRRVGELVECVFNGGVFNGIGKGVSVRINRRVTAGFIDVSKYKAYYEDDLGVDEEPGAELDAKLSIGLMILLKEYLKDTQRAQIWEDCKQFSQFFKPEWRYRRGKLKAAVNDVEIIDQAVINELGFSYKQGSFGLTPAAMMELARMTGHVATKVPASKNGEIARPADAPPGKVAALIGLTTNGFSPGLGDDVKHWVYAPTLPFTPRVDSVWSYGSDDVIGTGLLDGYEPKIAITLIRP
jgi:hypothetical protein